MAFELQDEARTIRAFRAWGSTTTVRDISMRSTVGG